MKVEVPNSAENPIQNSEIAELEEPMKQLLDQLRGNISSHRYGLLIGDDKSGRIPTRILRKVIDAINYNNENQPIPTIYLDGYKDPDDYKKMVKEFHAKAWYFIRQKPPKPRVLLVTEFIDEGRTLINFSKLFRRDGFTFDIATISMNKRASYYRNKKLFPTRTKLFYGQSYNGYMGSYDRGPRVYRRYNLTGNFSYYDRLLYKQHPPTHQRALDVVRSATQDVDILANRLVYYWYQKR